MLTALNPLPYHSAQVPGPKHFAGALPVSWKQPLMQHPRPPPCVDADGRLHGLLEMESDSQGVSSFDQWLDGFWAQVLTCTELTKMSNRQAATCRVHAFFMRRFKWLSSVASHQCAAPSMQAVSCLTSSCRLSGCPAREQMSGSHILGTVLLQVKTHWDGGIPAALKDHALVPVTGALPDSTSGTASAQHCADRILIRNCDLRQFPLAALPAELMARLAALGCLVTDDPRCDRLRVLDSETSCDPPAAPPSKARVLAALQALPEEELLVSLTALAQAADVVPSKYSNAAKAVAEFSMVRELIADAVPALPVDGQLRDGFLGRLPVFRYAVGGHGPAADAWLAPTAEWDLILRPCAELLPQPLLASAQVPCSAMSAA